MTKTTGVPLSAMRLAEGSSKDNMSSEDWNALKQREAAEEFASLAFSASPAPAAAARYLAARPDSALKKSAFNTVVDALLNTDHGTLTGCFRANKAYRSWALSHSGELFRTAPAEDGPFGWTILPKTSSPSTSST